MTQQINLIEISKGEKFELFLLIRKVEFKQNKNNKTYVALELGDKSGSLPANLWDNFSSFVNYLKIGEILFIEGMIEDYQGQNQIKVEKFRLRKDSENISPQDFLPVSLRDAKIMKAEFSERVEKITNTFLLELIKNIFTSERFEKYTKAPAGKAWHHAYIGGLLEHTLEMVKLADTISDLHPDLDRDLLITGVLLHDLGKTIELSYETAFEYNDYGRFLGHIYIGASLVEEEIKKIPNFPEMLRLKIIHLILAHQGKLEHASPVTPKTVEAIALYHIDELSAKVNAYKNAIKSDMGMTKWTKYIHLAETELYKLSKDHN